MLHIDELFATISMTCNLKGVVGIDYDSRMPYLKVGSSPVPLSAYVLLYVTQGSMCYQLGGRERQIDKGSFVLYAPWTKFSIRSKSDDFHGHQLFCDKAIFDRLVMENGGDVGLLQIRRVFPVVTLTDKQSMDVVKFLELMISAIDGTERYREQIVMGLLRTIQLYITELMASIVDSITLSSQREALYRDFMKLAVEHFQKERQLSFYAGHLCISTTYLSRIVRSVSGRTVKEILLDMVFTEACYRLRNTAQSIGEISYKLGFEDLSAFTHFFRNRCGRTPNQYRHSS